MARLAYSEAVELGLVPRRLEEELEAYFLTKGQYPSGFPRSRGMLAPFFKVPPWLAFRRPSAIMPSPFGNPPRAAIQPLRFGLGPLTLGLGLSPAPGAISGGAPPIGRRAVPVGGPTDVATLLARGEPQDVAALLRLVEAGLLPAGVLAALAARPDLPPALSRAVASISGRREAPGGAAGGAQEALGYTKQVIGAMTEAEKFSRGEGLARQITDALGITEPVPVGSFDLPPPTREAFEAQRAGERALATEPTPAVPAMLPISPDILSGLSGGAVAAIPELPLRGGSFAELPGLAEPPSPVIDPAILQSPEYQALLSGASGGSIPPVSELARLGDLGAAAVEPIGAALEGLSAFSPAEAVADIGAVFGDVGPAAGGILEGLGPALGIAGPLLGMVGGGLQFGQGNIAGGLAPLLGAGLSYLGGPAGALAALALGSFLGAFGGEKKLSKTQIYNPQEGNWNQYGFVNRDTGEWRIGGPGEPAPSGFERDVMINPTITRTGAHYYDIALPEVMPNERFNPTLPDQGKMDDNPYGAAWRWTVPPPPLPGGSYPTDFVYQGKPARWIEGGLKQIPAWNPGGEFGARELGGSAPGWSIQTFAPSLEEQIAQGKAAPPVEQPEVPGGFSMQAGGPVPRTGPYRLHAGEFVIPAPVMQTLARGGAPRSLGSEPVEAEAEQPWYLDTKEGPPFQADTNPDPSRTWRLATSPLQLREALDEGEPVVAISRKVLSLPPTRAIPLIERARKAQYDQTDRGIEVLGALTTQ